MNNSLVERAKKLYFEENNSLLGEGLAIQPWCYLHEHQMEAWIEKAKRDSLKESSVTKNETTFGPVAEPKTGRELYDAYRDGVRGDVKPPEYHLASEAEKGKWEDLAKSLEIASRGFKSSAAAILSDARAIVSGDRQTVNGKPERSFAQLAQMWSAYLGAPVTDVDCAQMLALLKMVRAKSGVTKGDHFVDQVGYSALAGELAANGTP